MLPGDWVQEQTHSLATADGYSVSMDVTSLLLWLVALVIPAGLAIVLLGSAVHPVKLRLPKSVSDLQQRYWLW